jgi:hypothetical protein
MSVGEILKKYPLQVIVIQRPYDTFTTSDFTSSFMTDLFKLKFEGYCSRYPYGIMPVSDYDFMATHVCMTLKVGSEYVLISAFKSITSEVCKDFRVPFPIINHKFGMFKEKFPTYVEALAKWQSDLDAKNKMYAYNASWTMKTDLDKELRGLMRDLTFAFFYFHYTTEKIDFVINSTSANFNVNKHQEAMGLKYLKDAAGNDLPPFKSPVFFEEPFYIMHVDETGFSDVYAEKCKVFKEAWDNRIIVNKENPGIGIKRKAA